MRSMIIDGKQQIENRTNIRKEIIVWIFGGVGTYVTFAVICLLLTGKKNENKGEKGAEKKEATRKEKEN